MQLPSLSDSRLLNSPRSNEPLRYSRTKDWAIRTIVVLWFSLMAAVTARGIVVAFANAANGGEIAPLLSKICLFSFVVMIAWLTIVRAPATARATGVQPAITAFLGTNLVFLGVLLLHPREDLPAGLHLLSAALVTAGNALAVFSLHYLGRSFSIMAEARQVVSRGPYKIIRHPLYVAEQIAIIGIFIQYASLAAFILILMQLACQLMRIRNEEILLRDTFPEYAGYMAQTARIIPGLW